MNKLIALFFYVWLYFTITILLGLYLQETSKNCKGQLIKSLKMCIYMVLKMVLKPVK